MKVICIKSCQYQRKKRFIAGKEYEIDEALYKKNKEYFKKIKETEVTPDEK